MIQIFNTHRPLLFGIAYRMLGGVSDADDMTQEVWLRWQKQDLAQIQSPKAWLVSAVTRLCIDQLRSARRVREEYYGVWLPEPLMPKENPVEPKSAAMAESLTMAFMLMLEALDPRERAVFLLREVFDYEYSEIAAIVGTSEANCRQIIRRAKVDLRGAAQPLEVTPTAEVQRLVEQFLAVAATGDAKDVLALLEDGCSFYSDGGGRVKAAGRAILGADAVSRFVIGVWPRFPADTEFRMAEINGQPGVLMLSQGQVFQALSIQFDAGRARNFYLVCNPEKLRHLSDANRGPREANGA